MKAVNVCSVACVLFIGPFVALPGLAADKRFEFSTEGDFSEAALHHGVKATKAQCDSAGNAVWASTADHGEECLRYWAAGFKGKPAARAVVFFHGDLLTETGVPPAYVNTSSPKIQRMTEDTARKLDLPYVFVGRPGTHGSSGDHRKRRLLAESMLISAALDKIKAKLQVGTWVVAGQSGGGHVTSSLLTERADIVCAVPTSSPSSPRLRWTLRGMKKDSTGRVDSYEPSEHLQPAKVHPNLRVFVLGDPKDSNVPWPSQTIMADKLKQAGIPVEVLRGSGAGPRSHGLPQSARLVASWCFHDVSTEEILRRAASGLKG